jgi:hypothetical protein
MKYEPGLIQINKHDEHLMTLMAMRMNLGLGDFGRGLGATTETKGSHKN